jgi:RNA polymerase sigma factor (sigma-70 family)
MDLGLAYFVVNRIRGRIPSWLPYEDATAAALIGYIKARNKDDESKDTEFSTLAVPYIKGSIFDEARRWKWFPRYDRDMSMSSLDEPCEQGDCYLLDTLQSREKSPESAAADREILAKATGVLSQKEQKMITLYLCYGYNLSEVGEVYGIRKSTCGDYIDRALDKIKQEAAKLGLQPKEKQKRLLKLSEEVKEKAHKLAIETNKSVKQICVDIGCKKSQGIAEIIRKARNQRGKKS